MAIADDISATEGILVLAAIGIFIYVIYEASSGFSNFANSLFGVKASTNPASPNYVEPYSTAAGQVASNPTGAITSILTPSNPSGPSILGNIENGSWDNSTIPGTGQTVSQLKSLGYAESDIASLIVLNGTPVAPDSTDQGYTPPSGGSAF